MPSLAELLALEKEWDATIRSRFTVSNVFVSTSGSTLIIAAPEASELEKIAEDLAKVGMVKTGELEPSPFCLDFVQHFSRAA